MKRIWSVLPVIAMTAVFAAGCGASGAEESSSAAAKNESVNIKFYGKCVEYASGPMMTDALEKKVADKYIVESIQINWADEDKVIRTGIASGEPCDIYNYTPRSLLANFADMAVDLKPYLDNDSEFKSFFTAEQLEACSTADGRILCLPWENNFSTILVNKTELDKLGIVIPESWTMAEFTEICQKIKDVGYYPFCNATDLARGNWIYRNAMLSITVGNGTYEQYISGELGVDSEESRQALEATKSLYDNDYMYPGEGAVTAKSDELKAAFYQGKVLMLPEIAASAKTTASEADFEVATVSWPSAGEANAVLGSYNALFIPNNAANIDAAVDVMKAYLSEDIQKIHSDQGYIPANVKVEVTDEFVSSIIKQADTVKQLEQPQTTSYVDYTVNTLMADLILNGGVDTAMENMKAAVDADSN